MRDIRPELLDEWLSGYEKPSDLLGEDGIFRELKKRLLERAELSDHLGYEKGQRSGRRGANNRDGHIGKTVLTDEGRVGALLQQLAKGDLVIGHRGDPWV